MRLKSRLTTVLILVLAAYAVLHFLLQQGIVLPSYRYLETAEAENHLLRCVEALNGEVDHLDRFNHDWAAWDDTYQFMQDRNRQYIDSNLVLETFTGNALAVICLCDRTGDVHWGKALDPGGEILRPIPSLDAVMPLSTHLRSVLDHRDGAVKGVIDSADGPMLFSARTILRSDGQGDAAGVFIMGQLLTTALISEMNQQTRIEHHLYPLSGGQLPATEKRILAQMDSSGLFLDRNDAHVLSAYRTIDDVHGEPILLLKARIPRSIYRRGNETVRMSLLSDLILGLSLTVVLLFVVQRMVVNPLDRLTRYTRSIRETDDLSLRSGIRGSDEIGQLGQTFDQLVARVQHIQVDLETIVDNRTAELKTANERLSGEIRGRERTEAALQLANDRLECQVDERTRALEQANAELRKAMEKRLERDKRLKVYHRKLRKLSAELLLTEERERRRIATELHDGVGQTLSMAKLELDRIAATALPEPTAGLQTVSERLSQALDGTRMLTFELSPPILYELGLEAALEWLCEEIQARHGLTVAFSDDGSPKPLEPTHRVMLFQAGRELLFNVVKHAQAGRASVDIRSEEGFVRICFWDDGKGFDTGRLNGNHYRHSGFGLFSIRERLRNMGGRMEIDSEPGEGTRVSISAPLSAAARPHSSEKLSS